MSTEAGYVVVCTRLRRIDSVCMLYVLSFTLAPVDEWGETLQEIRGSHGAGDDGGGLLHQRRRRGVPTRA